MTMKTMKRAAAALVAASMLSSPVLAASAVRPAMASLPAVGGTAGSGSPLGPQFASGMRAGSHVGKSSQLLGAPLFLVFLGAVAVTIGTIVIVNHNSSSPG